MPLGVVKCDAMRTIALAGALLTLTFIGCSRNDGYECIERSSREIADPLGMPGTHTEISYVLLHQGHKIYASCDGDSIGSLDPNSTCGFRPLRTYNCVPGEVGIHAKGPLSDLKCKDDDGFNVYLYVSKKD